MAHTRNKKKHREGSGWNQHHALGLNAEKELPRGWKGKKKHKYFDEQVGDRVL